MKSRARPFLFPGALLASLALAGLPAAAAVISPSGVNWSTRHVVGLVSDDLGTGEYLCNAINSTRYGLNVPWTGEQWSNVADAVRGHPDRFGVQIPLTLYLVAACAEPDFTPLVEDSGVVFSESFSGPVPGWSLFGSHPPTITTFTYVSPPASATFDTPTLAADGWARRYLLECKEYEVRFWFRLGRVDARTHLVSVAGATGRAMGIEAQQATSQLYLREGFYSDDEILSPIAPYQLGVWRQIAFRAVGGRVTVDLDVDGTVELERPAAFLPTLTNQVILGDPSTTKYSGQAYVDDLSFTRFDNQYPSLPRVTPLAERFPDAAAAVQAARDVFVVQSHGYTHANDAEIQRRYAQGQIADLGEAEEEWWREDYDAVNERPVGVAVQSQRFLLAWGLIEDAFGRRPVVHVSPGNVFGPDTDAALAEAGLHFHEAMDLGGGAASPYDPGVFWSSRTGEQELFYQDPDPNPLLAASLAKHGVDSLFALGSPAIMSTHAFNALIGGDGAALATFYDRFLTLLASGYSDLVAVDGYEMAQLERDGVSVSEPRSERIYARNYLPSPHRFRIPVPSGYSVSSVRRMNDGELVEYRMAYGELEFDAVEGDYVVRLAVYPPTAVPGEESRPAPVASLRVRPNPARSAVQVEAAIPVAGPATVEVVDAQGRRVRQLTDGWVPAGSLGLSWDGVGEDGRRAAPGIYFVRGEWNGGRAHAKLLLVR